METPEVKSFSFLKSWRARSIAGLSVLSAVSFGAWDYVNRSGGYEHFYPKIHRQVKIDDVQSVLAWNMHDQASQRADEIKAIDQKYHVDANLLQEVDHDDAARLAKKMPGWHLIYELADRGQHFAEGGYGNAILTRHGPEDIKTAFFAGTSAIDTIGRTLTGAVIDLATVDTSFQAVIDARQERRAAMAVTNQVLSGGILHDIRLIDGHISGNSEVQPRQLKDAMGFIGETTSNIPAVACMDFNQPDRALIAKKFAKIGYKLAPKNMYTSPDGLINGDFCGYHSVGAGTSASVKVITKYETDHYPMLFTWKMDGAKQAR